MHAFLLVGTKKENIDQSIEKITRDLGAKPIEFPLIKIDDVRSLNDLLRLSFNEKTLIVAKGIEGATEEALNALLKNLEEPQENIYFALTTSSTKKVLPTIVSRCQVMQVTPFAINNGDDNDKEIETKNEEISNFLRLNSSQKIAFFDKIGDRNKAIEFIESVIFFLHERKEFSNMEILTKTLTCLKANGNVNLHLLNLVVNFK